MGQYTSSPANCEEELVSKPGGLSLLSNAVLIRNTSANQPHPIGRLVIYRMPPDCGRPPASPPANAGRGCSGDLCRGDQGR